MIAPTTDLSHEHLEGCHIIFTCPPSIYASACSTPKIKIKIEIPSPRKKESPREEATKKVGKNKKTIHTFSAERRGENVPELVGIVENVDTGEEVVVVLAAVRRRGAASEKKSSV